MSFLDAAGSYLKSAVGSNYGRASSGSGGSMYSSSVNDDTATTYKGGTGDIFFSGASSGGGGLNINQIVIAGLVFMVCITAMRGR